jgi:hypothetical protein
MFRKQILDTFRDAWNQAAHCAPVSTTLIPSGVGTTIESNGAATTILTPELQEFVNQVRQAVPSFSVDQITPNDVPLILRALSSLRDDSKLFTPPFEDAKQVALRIVLPGWTWFISYASVFTRDATPFVPGQIFHGASVSVDVPSFTIHWNGFHATFLYTDNLVVKRTRERDLPPRAAKRARK